MKGRSNPPNGFYIYHSPGFDDGMCALYLSICQLPCECHLSTKSSARPRDSRTVSNCHTVEGIRRLLVSLSAASGASGLLSQ